MTKEELLTAISKLINEYDAKQQYHIGDELFDLIIFLKKIWGFEL